MSGTHSSARPVTVTAAFIIWLVTVLIGLIGGVLVLASASAVLAEGLTTSPSVPSASVFLATGILVVVLSLVQLLIVFKMRNGKNWARIVLAALTVFQVVGVFTGAGGVGALGLASAAVATVLMFVPASNADFRRH